MKVEKKGPGTIYWFLIAALIGAALGAPALGEIKPREVVAQINDVIEQIVE